MVLRSSTIALWIVYSMPWRASSFGGSTQHARRAANISRIESSACSPAVMTSPFSVREASSSFETIVSRKSCPIGGR